MQTKTIKQTNVMMNMLLVWKHVQFIMLTILVYELYTSVAM